MEPGQTFPLVEYLSIFTAFIYGYVATRFFSGWSAMINFRHCILVSHEQLLWTILTFGLLIDVWWGSWLKGSTIAQHVTLYYLSLITPLIFYIISVIFFPPLVGDHFVDLRSYFEKTRKKNYAAFIALFLSFELGSYFFENSFEKDPWFNFSAAGLAAVGYISKWRVLHRTILFIGWVMLLLHIGLQPQLDLTHGSRDNFSFTEYLTVFVAFIYGFIASRYFSCWGVLITRLDRITLSHDHVGWTLLSFVLLLDLWIGSWLRETYMARSILYFILSLGTPLAFYSLSAVIFPVIRNGEKTDMNVFFTANRKIIIFLIGAVLPVNTVVANVMEEPALYSRENGFRLAALVMMVVAVSTRKLAWERSMLGGGWILLLSHIALESGIV